MAALSCTAAMAQTLPQLPNTLPPAPPPPLAKRQPVLETPRNIPAAARRAQGPLSLLVLLENSADPSDPTVRRIVVREEATSGDYYTRYDGGSLRAVLKLRCATGEFQLENLRLYSRNNLAGDVLTSLDRPSAWQTAAAG